MNEVKSWKEWDEAINTMKTLTTGIERSEYAVKRQMIAWLCKATELNSDAERMKRREMVRVIKEGQQ